MKKLIIVIIFFLTNFSYVNAENLTCKNEKNNEIINISYDFEKIELDEKRFKDIFVFGNGMSAEYLEYKSLFLGFGKTLDEKWEIDIELRNPKSVVLTKFKYYANEPKKISENKYLCN